jgi:hypothetical protein
MILALCIVFVLFDQISWSKLGWSQDTDFPDFAKDATSVANDRERKRPPRPPARFQAGNSGGLGPGNHHPVGLARPLIFLRGRIEFIN